jgi:hypothetical protein
LGRLDHPVPTSDVHVDGIAPPAYLPLWQVVGMLILVYAPAYWWVARRPSQHRHLVVIGLLGEVLGPVAFVGLRRAEILP